MIACHAFLFHTLLIFILRHDCRLYAPRYGHYVMLI